MNKVQESIAKNVVQPALDKLGSIRVGTIEKYNPQTKEATVTYSSVDGDSTASKSIPYVPMIRQEGTHEAGPYIGDKVVLGFINNDISKPIILGAIDQRHAINRRLLREQHGGKGTNVSDHYTQRSGAGWNVERFRL